MKNISSALLFFFVLNFINAQSPVLEVTNISDCAANGGTITVITNPDFGPYTYILGLFSNSINT